MTREEIDRIRREVHALLFYAFVNMHRGNIWANREERLMYLEDLQTAEEILGLRLREIGNGEIIEMLISRIADLTNALTSPYDVEVPEDYLENPNDLDIDETVGKLVWPFPTLKIETQDSDWLCANVGMIMSDENLDAIGIPVNILNLNRLNSSWLLRNLTTQVQLIVDLSAPLTDLDLQTRAIACLILRSALTDINGREQVFYNDYYQEIDPLHVNGGTAHWVRGYVSVLRHPKFYHGEDYPPEDWKIRVTKPYFVSGRKPENPAPRIRLRFRGLF